MRCVCWTDFPRVLSAAGDSAVVANTSVELPCQGAGTPSPTTLWTLPGRPQPVAVGEVLESQHPSRRVQVLPDGTLRLSSADEGSHTCLLVNTAGGVRAQSWLTVVPRQHLPPPLLTRTPPHTLTLPAGTPATLPCRARGPPLAAVTWYRGTVPLRPLPPRVNLTEDGDLIFNSKYFKFTKMSKFHTLKYFQSHFFLFSLRIKFHRVILISFVSCQ